MTLYIRLHVSARKAIFDRRPFDGRPLSQRQINIGDHFLFAHVGADIDVVKEHREVANLFAGAREPVFMEVHRRLVVLARADVPRERATVTGDQLVDDAQGVGADIAVDGKAEIDAMFARPRSARIGIMNAVTAVPYGIQQAMLELPPDQSFCRLVFEIRSPGVLDGGDFRFRKDHNADIHQWTSRETA
jgi:hypothetical protein